MRCYAFYQQSIDFITLKLREKNSGYQPYQGYYKPYEPKPYLLEHFYFGLQSNPELQEAFFPIFSMLEERAPILACAQRYGSLLEHLNIKELSGLVCAYALDDPERLPPDRVKQITDYISALKNLTLAEEKHSTGILTQIHNTVKIGRLPSAVENVQIKAGTVLASCLDQIDRAQKKLTALESRVGFLEKKMLRLENTLKAAEKLEAADPEENISGNKTSFSFF